MQVRPDSNYLLAFQSIYRKCCSSANLSAPDPAIPFYYYPEFAARFELGFDSTNLTVASWRGSGPSQRVQNIALVVLGLGQILPILPPVPM
jgi:hypothetical protein